MQLQVIKAEPFSLKEHPDFSEKWLQQRVVDDPTILGLGEVEAVTAEKTQPKAGRLDVLLHDDQLNRRYEVELMLGRTDPSHIMRCIEYWDIERRRYPAYDHVAVLVAEDITARFLNLMALLAGSIPLIAIQLVALKIDDKVALHFVHVLDQTGLRTDDAYEAGGGPSEPQTTDRVYWEKRTSPSILRQCDLVTEIVEQLTGEPHSLLYRRRIIDVVPANGGDTLVWLVPRKTLIRIGAYVLDPVAWVKRFDDAGQTASLRRGNKAVLVSYKPQEIETQGQLLRSFLQESHGSAERDDSQTSVVPYEIEE